jgi:hypothetical protein
VGACAARPQPLLASLFTVMCKKPTQQSIFDRFENRAISAICLQADDTPKMTIFQN